MSHEKDRAAHHGDPAPPLNNPTKDCCSDDYIAGALSVPDEIADDTDTLTAALAYAAAGWYVLPIKSGTKHPGSVLGKGWQKQSSRDAGQIAAWWAGTDHGIALHCGRSGAVVLDIDNPAAVPDVIADHAATAPAQQTRPDTPQRRHLVYAVPEGRRIGNGNGKLGGGWGEVRGQNGVVVVAPSHHPDGGEYRWQKTGIVPELPAAIADLLPNADLCDADAATDTQVAAFLDRHTAANQPGLLRAVVNRWGEKMSAGESRHNTAASLTAWAMEEAAAGLYPAKDADNALAGLFVAAKTDAQHSGGRPLMTARQAAHAWAGIRAWAVGRANAKTADKLAARTEHTAALPTEAEQLAQMGGITPPQAKAPPARADDTTTKDDAVQPHPPAAAGTANLHTESEQPAQIGGIAPPKLGLTWASDVRDTIPEWAWTHDDRGQILRGGLTLFSGRPGAGKSTTARWFAAGWSQGTLPGCFTGQPINIAYVATEEAWNHTVKPSLRAAGADLQRVAFINRGDDPARIDSTADEAELAEIFVANNIHAVVLDPLVSTLRGGVDINRTNEVRAALDPWVRIAEKIRGPVVGIVHLTKSPGGDVLAGINGSSAFGEVARCAFGFAVDTEADDGTHVLSQVKNSSGRAGLNLAYRIAGHRVTTDDGGTADVARFELIGPTERSVRELLIAERSAQTESGTDRCTKWLKGYLVAHGRVLREDVMAAGIEFGFSKRMIERSAASAGVCTERTREVPSRTFWWMQTGAT